MAEAGLAPLVEGRHQAGSSEQASMLGTRKTAITDLIFFFRLRIHSLLLSYRLPVVWSVSFLFFTSQRGSEGLENGQEHSTLYVALSSSVSSTELTWQTNFSFYVLSTLVTWVAFGMAIRIPLILNENLRVYNDITPPGDLAPVNARAGNATWLILTGAVRASSLSCEWS